MSSCSTPKAQPLSIPDRTVTPDVSAGKILVEEAHAAADSPGVTTWVIDEAAANGLALTYLANAPIQDLTVWFEPDLILVQAHATWRGEHVIVAAGRASVHRDTLDITLDAATFDGMAIPRWIRASIAHAASDALSDATLPVTIRDIALHEGVMVVTVGR